MDMRGVVPAMVGTCLEVASAVSVVLGIACDCGVDFRVGDRQTSDAFDADGRGFETGGMPVLVHRSEIDNLLLLDDELDLSAFFRVFRRRPERRGGSLRCRVSRRVTVVARLRKRPWAMRVIARLYP